MAGNRTTYVCFEAKVHPEKEELGNQFYTEMQDLVATQSGFISEVPFASTTQEGGQILIVKFETDEQLHAWRKHPAHLKIQAKARAHVLVNYRIRSGHAFVDHDEDNNVSEPSNVPSTSYMLLWKRPNSNKDQTNHEVSGDNKLSLTLATSLTDLVDATTYINETHNLQLTSWSSRAAAISMRNAIPQVENGEVVLLEVKRDYGKFQRKEAPKDADACQIAASAD